MSTNRSATCLKQLTTRSARNDETGTISVVSPPLPLCQLNMLSSGNMTVSCNGVPIWSSNTSVTDTSPYYFLEMQPDANLVMYNGTFGGSGAAVWSANSSVPIKCGVPLPHAPPHHHKIPDRQRYNNKLPDREHGSEEGGMRPIALAEITNHDYFIANKAFFFDLSIWTDETPNDDPHQPLGTDHKTLLAILDAAYTGGSDHGQGMLHIGGFIPWAYKYVKEGDCGAACRHGGVETEWATVCITSGFNAYVDGDACCVGSCANAALWQHASLPTKLHQPTSEAPTLSQLKTRGLVDKHGRVKPYFFAGFYGGDYDSAAWAYSQYPLNWNDPKRGDIPIGWALDHMIAYRFPLIFDYVYSTATANDVIISGDSGGGYLNPSQLIPPRVGSNITTSGVSAFQRWNTERYAQFNVSFTGFVINGDAGLLGPEGEAIYDAFSPAGIVVSPNQDYRGVGLGGGVTPRGTPVIHHVTDLPGGNATAAAIVVADIVELTPRFKPQFAMFRTILQSATFHADVATIATERVAARLRQLVWVDPLTLGALVKLHHEHTDDGDGDAT
eukprot:m.41959 g.41959  ORF g.41959 m.41959 type:complete len:557 (+) comp6201_c0_seq1:79-1749(+)